MATFQITGRITDEQGAPIAGAHVRLSSDLATLGSVPGAVVAQPTAVTWTRTITGFSGHRWNAFTKFVGGQVAGISFVDFKEAVVTHNPSLAETSYGFQAEQSYQLPENDPASLAIAWDRPLAGFTGNRWQCWTDLVAGKVIGMDWRSFKDAVVEQNPQLAASGYVFAADVTYRLPHNPNLPTYEVSERASASGRYGFAGLPAGEYLLEVRVDDRLRHSQRLTVAGDQQQDVTLFAPMILMQTSPAFVQPTPSEFRLNGQSFGRFVGVNLPHLLHYGDTSILAPSQEGHQREMLNKVKEVKGRVVRVFLPHHKCSNAVMIERLRRVLGLMDEFDMYLLPTFIDLYSNAGAFPQTTNLDVDYIDFQDNSGHRVRLSDAFFSERYKGFYLDFVKAVVTEFTHHPRIFAWEIGNEMKHEILVAPGQRNGNPDQLVNFKLDVARQIKGWDEGRHMVTTGLLCTRHAYMEPRPDLVRKLYGGPENPIDFLTVHAYESGADVDTTWAFQLERPVIVEEAGIDRPLDSFADRLRAEMNRFFNHTEYQHNGGEPKPRRKASGYLLWRFNPVPVGEASGDFHDDFNIIKQVFAEFV